MRDKLNRDDRARDAAALNVPTQTDNMPSCLLLYGLRRIKSTDDTI